MQNPRLMGVLEDVSRDARLLWAVVWTLLKVVLVLVALGAIAFAALLVVAYFEPHSAALTDVHAVIHQIERAIRLVRSL